MKLFDYHMCTQCACSKETSSLALCPLVRSGIAALPLHMHSNTTSGIQESEGYAHPRRAGHCNQVSGRHCLRVQQAGRISADWPRCQYPPSQKAPPVLCPLRRVWPSRCLICGFGRDPSTSPGPLSSPWEPTAPGRPVQAARRQTTTR